MRQSKSLLRFLSKHFTVKYNVIRIDPCCKFDNERISKSYVVSIFRNKDMRDLDSKDRSETKLGKCGHTRLDVYIRQDITFCPKVYTRGEYISLFLRRTTLYGVYISEYTIMSGAC